MTRKLPATESEAVLTRFSALNVPHDRQEQTVAAVWEQLIWARESRSMVLLFGPTGVGKSHVLEELKANAVQASTKILARPDHLPFLAVEALAPTRSVFSLPALLRQALEAGHEPLLDKKRIVYPLAQEFSSYSKPTLELSLQHLLHERRPWFWAVDEAQHLAYANAKVQAAYLDVLKGLANRSGTPILLIGSYSLVSFTRFSGQLARRRSELHYARYSDSDRDQRSFANAARFLWEALPLAAGLSRSLPAELEALYDGSVGCIGILKEWFWRALARTLTSDGRLERADLDQTRLSSRKLQVLAEEVRAGESELEDTRPSAGQAAATRNEVLDRPRPARQRPGERNPVRDPVEFPAGRELPSPFYAIEPVGVGSSFVESLTSYARRLAVRHVLSASALIDHLVREESLARGRNVWVSAALLHEDINGIRPLTQLIVERLARFTGVAAVTRTTFLSSAGTLQFYGMLREQRAWCACCLQTDAVGYDRLLWALRPYRACGQHNCALQDRCRRCNRGHRPWQANASPCFCPHCGARLWADHLHNPDERSSEPVLEDLVGLLQSGREIDGLAVAGAVRYLAHRAGGITRLSRRVGIVSRLPRLGLSRPPSPLDLVALTQASELALPQVLAAGDAFRTARDPGFPVSRNQSSRLALETAAALRKPLDQTPSPYDLARKCHVAAATLRESAPDSFAELVRRRRAGRAGKRHQRERQTLESMRLAMVELRGRGVPVTLRRLQSLPGLKNVRRNARLAELYREFQLGLHKA